MADDFKFCYKCGVELPEGSDFCPECGNRVDPTAAAGRTEYTATPVQEKKGNLGAVPIMVMIYGVLAIITAVFFAIVGLTLEALIQMIINAAEQGVIPEEQAEELLALISQITIGTLQLYMVICAAFMALSGILALVSGHYAGRMVKFKLCFASCVIASLLPAMLITVMPFSFVLTIVGLLMCYFIYSKRESFTD